MFFFFLLFSRPSTIVLNECEKYGKGAHITKLNIEPAEFIKGEKFDFELEASTKNYSANYYFEMRVGYEYSPFIRERGDFCRGEMDKCSKGILRHHESKIFPSYLAPGSYDFKVLIYNESKVPIDCKTFNFKYVEPKPSD